MSSLRGTAWMLYAAIALSAGSLALSGWLLATRPGTAGPAAASASSCNCDDQAIRRELAELRQLSGQVAAQGAGIRALTERVNAFDSRDGGSAAPRVAAAADHTDRLPSGDPVYVELRAPSKAVSVKQDPNGSLSVTNTDPSLTGKTMVIQAVDGDGQKREVSVVVPPPQ